MTLETLKIIRGKEIPYLIEKGFGKLVYTIVMDNPNYVLDDEDIQCFDEKSIYYESQIRQGYNVKTHRVLAKEYRKMYEDLTATCNERKRIMDNIVTLYPTMWDYHLNYNDSFAQNKLGGLRYGI